MAEKTVLSPGSTFSGLSRYALDAIKGKWGVTIGAFVLNVVIKGAVQQIPIVGPLFAGYFLFPLDVGVMLFFGAIFAAAVCTLIGMIPKRLAIPLFLDDENTISVIRKAAIRIIHASTSTTTFKTFFIRSFPFCFY